MKKTEIINGVTAKIEIEKDAQRSHLTTFKNLQKAINFCGAIYNSAFI